MRGDRTAQHAVRHVGDCIGFGVGNLEAHQVLRDDADGSATAAARRAGHRTHCRDSAATPHQGPAALGDRLAEFGSER